MAKKNRSAVVAAIAAGITVVAFGSIFLLGGKYVHEEEDSLLVLSDERVPLADIQELLKEDRGYSLEIDGINISMDAPALPIIVRLGTPTTYSESENMDRVYSYDEFEIATHVTDEGECIAAVFIMDESIMTPEGVSVGMTLDDMEDVYGTDYIEDDDMYIYESNGMGLEFLISDGVIVYMQYLSAIYM